MTKSPFRRYANALLRVSVLTEYLRTDPKTGNREPITETQELRALLKPTTSKDDTKERQLAGINLSEVYLEGYLVDPMQLPETLSMPLECEAEIDGQKGTLRLRYLVASPWGEERKTGQKIKGYFRKAGS